MKTINVVWVIVSAQSGIVDDVWTYTDEAEARLEFDRLRRAWMGLDPQDAISEREWRSYLEAMNDDLKLFRTVTI